MVASSIQEARHFFKGSEPNDREGQKIAVQYKIVEDEEDIVRFSNNDMQKMEADPGDLVYLTDKRKIFGGLKSIHSVYGEPHNEDGIVYINSDQQKTGLFVKGRILIAEKEL